MQAFRNKRNWKTVHASARSTQSAWVANGKYWFVGDSTESNWDLVDLSADEFSSSMKLEFETTLKPMLEQATYFSAMPVPEFFSLPCVEILDRYEDLQDSDLVCVKYECSEPYDKIPGLGVTILYLRGVVKFSWSRNMAIDSFDVERGAGTLVLKTGNWSSHNGLTCSVPQSISYTTNYTGQSPRTVDVVNEFGFESIPRSEFLLPAFGIPEPDWLRQSIWNRTWVYWVGATLGLFVVGGIFRRLRK